MNVTGGAAWNAILLPSCRSCATRAGCPSARSRPIYGVSADFLLGRAPSPTCTPEQLEALRVLVQDVRTAADRAEAALEEIAL